MMVRSLAIERFATGFISTGRMGPSQKKNVPCAPPDVREHDAKQRRQRHTYKQTDDEKSSNRIGDGFVHILNI